LWYLASQYEYSRVNSAKNGLNLLISGPDQFLSYDIKGPEFSWLYNVQTLRTYE